MTPLPRPKPLAVPPLQPGLPTMYDLPSEFPEEPGLPDIFHDLQPQRLSQTPVAQTTRLDAVGGGALALQRSGDEIPNPP